MIPLPLGEAILAFLKWGRAERMWRRNTVDGYDRFLRVLFAYFGQRDVESITPEDIKNWRIWMSNRKSRVHPSQNITQRTQQHYVIAARVLFKYLHEQEYDVLRWDRIALGPRPEREIEALTPSEIERFLEVSGQFREKLIAIRNRALAELMFSTGMRVSEMVNLKIRDVDLDTGETVIVGKGGQQRVVFLSDRCKPHVVAWLKIHPKTRDTLFITCRRCGLKDLYEPISHSVIHNMVRKTCRRAGIRPIHAHVLRHSFATTLLRNGIDLYSIQRLLGHRSLQSTQVYVHVTSPELKAAHRKGLKLPNDQA